MATFVWRHVLRDYSYGMAVIEAEDVDDAYKKVRESDLRDSVKEELLMNEPEELGSGEVAYVYGSS